MVDLFFFFSAMFSSCSIYRLRAESFINQFRVSNFEFLHAVLCSLPSPCPSLPYRIITREAEFLHITSKKTGRRTNKITRLLDWFWSTLYVSRILPTLSLYHSYHSTRSRSSIPSHAKIIYCLLFTKLSSTLLLNLSFPGSLLHVSASSNSGGSSSG